MSVGDTARPSYGSLIQRSQPQDVNALSMACYQCKRCVIGLTRLLRINMPMYFPFCVHPEILRHCPPGSSSVVRALSDTAAGEKSDGMSLP